MSHVSHNSTETYHYFHQKIAALIFMFAAVLENRLGSLTKTSKSFHFISPGGNSCHAYCDLSSVMNVSTAIYKGFSPRGWTYLHTYFYRVFPGPFNLSSSSFITFVPLSIDRIFSLSPSEDLQDTQWLIRKIEFQDSPCK